MRIVSARIIDPTHLELLQPLSEAPGAVIQISLPADSDDETAIWRDAAKQQLLSAYADEDAVYDDL
jgi:hypothetical protein